MSKYIALMMLPCLLTSCAFTRDFADIQYRPNLIPQRMVGAENIAVSVDVQDMRVKKNVGCKLNGYGIEMAKILPKNDVAEVFKNAIVFELQERGFVISEDGINLNIEIYKFFNDFKPGFFSVGAANSETFLNVTLRKGSMIAYSKTIFGFGEEETCFLTSGTNASLALEKSLHHAVQRLMDDPDFISSLLND